MKEELSRGEKTESIFDMVCFGEPLRNDDPEAIDNRVKNVMQLNEQPIFLEGLAERLTQLGTKCSYNDTDMILADIKDRYKNILGKSCPRTVTEWIRGTIPGVTNIGNNYELCYALEMDHNETAEFFQKCFLMCPFSVKSRTDAIFLYCMYHKKPYSTAAKMLEDSKGFASQEKAHTATSQILASIMHTDNDETFMRYLSEHCYNKDQQFMLARSIIKNEIDIITKKIIQNSTEASADISNSRIIEKLIGFRSQFDNRRFNENKIPKRFTESIPNDVTLGLIINGKGVTYELLRKTLMLLRFYNFYSDAASDDRNTIAGNLMDFYDELDNTLINCGFAQIYVYHPFDCLLLYCANSDDPIVTLHSVIDYGRN